jgi:TetR/AcrR family transcriptional repressor of nem operon
MPRASKEQAEAHRRLVIENSAKLIRERGIDGVSVADLMESAGLTHGGFYGHFDSKEQLVTEAFLHAFEASVERWNHRVAGGLTAADGFRALVEAYMTARNRDNPGTSCPAPALMSDVAREPASSAVRATYRDGVKQLLAIMQATQVDDDPQVARRHALAQFAMMVGSVALARATAGDPLSDEFLGSVRETLLETPKAQGSPVPRRRRH